MNGIIYKGYGFEACMAGFKAYNGPFLAVTRNGKGDYLSGTKAIEWAEAIRTAIDSKEAAALCRAIINANN